MKRRTLWLACILILFGAVYAFPQAQPQPTPPSFPTIDRQQDQDRPRTLRDQLTKARIERDRKNYQELLDRGDSALRLSEALESSLELNGEFTSEDLGKLAELEKVVTRIRRDLGGNSDKELERETQKEVSGKKDLVEIFSQLRSSTVNLVAELKKSSRFSISAAAIHASNSIISIARFLRLKK